MKKTIFFLILWILKGYGVFSQTVKNSDSCEAAQLHSYIWNFKAAAVAYESCLSAAKDSYQKGNITTNLGFTWFQLKDYEKAKKYYTLAAANYALAKSELVTSETANKTIKESQVKTGEMILARNRADCFCKTGDVSNALADYDKAISLGPDYAINYILKAECLREKEKFNEASALITQALQKDKNSIMAYVTRGKIEKDLKNAVMAKNYFMQAINISDTNSEPYYQLGLMSMDDIKFADAIRYFTSAISKNNTHPKNFAKRAVCFAKLGMADSARADLQRAKEKFAGDELITEAGLAIRMGNITPLVPSTIKSSNKELVQLYEKANLLKRERKIGDAFKEISKAIKLDPNNSDVFALSGEIGLISFEMTYPDAMDDKKFDFEKNDYWWLAVDDLSNAIKLNSNNAAAYYYRGMAMLMAGKKKDGIKDLEKAAQLKPGNSQIEEALKNAKSK